MDKQKIINKYSIITFISFIIAIIIFTIGVQIGKSYTLKYQNIEQTKAGYCVDFNYKNYYYNQEGVYEK